MLHRRQPPTSYSATQPTRTQRHNSTKPQRKNGRTRFLTTRVVPCPFHSLLKPDPFPWEDDDEGESLKRMLLTGKKGLKDDL